MAQSKSPTKLDRAMAKVCLNCPVCRKARKEQKGAAFWLTRHVESRICPFCLKYRQVYGRKAYEPLQEPANANRGMK